MIRFTALVMLCLSLVAPIAWAQVVYTSQTRSIAADGGLGATPRSSSAPNFEPWTDAVSSGFVTIGRASQSSRLDSGSASLSLAASGEDSSPFTSPNASSVCNFTFTCLVTLTAKIQGTGAQGASFALSGPGVAVAESAGVDGSNWDMSVLLVAGQTYTFASGASGSGQFSRTLNLTLTFVEHRRAFSYQGLVRDASGQPIATSTDMEFRLFSHQSLGDTQVGSTIAVSEVPVTNGLFTQILDFGDVFNGEALWLEVRVRNPAGSGAFTPVQPRTPILSVPHASYAIRAASAIHAASAAAAASVPWSGVTDVPPNVTGAFSPWAAAAGGINYANGRVGIGTGSPAAPLHLSTGAVGSGWQLQLTNSAALPTFETGMRMSDGGFFEITNRINGFTKFARLDSTGAWTAVSDARLKTDLSPFGDALDAALRVRPVRFKWIGDGMADFGVIAQELRSVLPEAVTGDELKDSLTVNYSKLSVVAIGAVQEQQAQIKVLQEQNTAKQREIEDLRSRLERLERLVEQSRPVVTRP